MTTTIDRFYESTDIVFVFVVYIIYLVITDEVSFISPESEGGRQSESFKHLNIWFPTSKVDKIMDW